MGRRRRCLTRPLVPVDGQRDLPSAKDRMATAGASPWGDGDHASPRPLANASAASSAVCLGRFCGRRSVWHGVRNSGPLVRGRSRLPLLAVWRRSSCPLRWCRSTVHRSGPVRSGPVRSGSWRCCGTASRPRHRLERSCRVRPNRSRPARMQRPGGACRAPAWPGSRLRAGRVRRRAAGSDPAARNPRRARPRRGLRHLLAEVERRGEIAADGAAPRSACGRDTRARCHRASGEPDDYRDVR